MVPPFTISFTTHCFCATVCPPISSRHVYNHIYTIWQKKGERERDQCPDETRIKQLKSCFSFYQKKMVAISFWAKIFAAACTFHSWGNNRSTLLGPPWLEAQYKRGEWLENRLKFFYAFPLSPHYTTTWRACIEKLYLVKKYNIHTTIFICFDLKITIKVIIVSDRSGSQV